MHGVLKENLAVAGSCVEKRECYSEFRCSDTLIFERIIINICVYFTAFC